MVSILQNNQYLCSLFPTELLHMMFCLCEQSLVSKPTSAKHLWTTSEVTVSYITIRFLLHWEHFFILQKKYCCLFHGDIIYQALPVYNL